MEVFVRKAADSDVDIIAKLVHLLLVELTEEDETPPEKETIHVATKELFRGNTPVIAFLAVSDEDEPIGILTLNECASIYAGGRFGEISELYVTPDGRSNGVGAKLLAAAKEFGSSKGWRRLEVGAPSVPRWQRTLRFYLRNGFDEVGPRLKILL